MIRVLACAETELEFDAFQDLIRKKIVSEVFFVTNDQNFLSFSEDLKVESFSVELTLKNLSNGNIPQFSQYFDFDLSIKMQEHISDFIRISKRVDPLWQMKATEVQRIFNQAVQYWHDLIMKHKIDVVYFTVVPHQSLEYVLYLVATHLGLKTYFFNENGVTGHKYLVSNFMADWEVLCNCAFSSDCEIEVKSRAKVIEDFTARVRGSGGIQYWQDQISNSGDNRWNYDYRSELGFLYRVGSSFIALSLKFFETLFSGSWKERGILGVEQLTKLHNAISNRAIYQRYAFTKREHRRLFTSELPKQYWVYFLSFEPEMMVNPLGGRFADQLHYISEIRKRMPANLELVIREHPAQFKSDIGFGYLGRDVHFYNYLKSLSGLVFVKDSIPTSEIISGASCVITINGSVGWEALCASKPVLVLGSIWYMDAPGTFSLSKVDWQFEVNSAISSNHILNLTEFLHRTMDKSTFFSMSRESANSIGFEWCHNHSYMKLVSVLSQAFIGIGNDE